MRIWKRKKRASYLSLLSQLRYKYFRCYCVVQVWFSWMVLNIESIFEEDSQLRRVVEGELIINDLSPDQALKVRELFVLYS